MSATSIAHYQDISPVEERGRHKSIFIWLDSLGFSEAVDDEFRYNELAELLRKFQSLFYEGNGYSPTIISDGIILQIINPNSGSFTGILQDIGEKQFNFICENEYFIRGGISIGTKLESNKKPGDHDSRQFISNGLARAVKIEERHVSWPVIGTNSTILSEIRNLFQINKDKEDFGLTKGFNTHGAELYFIDFLKENENYYKLLNRKMKTYRDKPPILNKYVWLLRYYHNRFGSDNLDESLAGVVI